MNSRKKVLVTGSKGFIGQCLISRLLNMNYEIYAFSSSNKNINNSRLNEFNVDLNQEFRVTKLVEKIQPDVLINLAYDWNADELPEHFNPSINRNLNMTLNLLNSCSVINKVPKFIHIGSCEEYGLSKIPFVETLLPNPVSNYGRNKFLISQKIQEYSDKKQINGITLRPSVVYGNDQKINMLIPYTISNLLEHKPVKIFFGNDTRDFIHVRDMVNAIILTMEADLSFAGGIINIASGESIIIKDLIKLILGYINPSLEHLLIFEQTQNDETHIKNYFVNIEKASQILQWRPEINLREGLIELIDSKLIGRK
jgi:nucleoside-diphosphate-sugar epimerase